MKLTAAQCRVLGVLIEKSLANPDGYPMTLNAITAGCNQKNNREPLTSYSEGEVGKVLHELGLMDLVSQAPPAIGARVNRFRQEVERRMSWGHRQQALMAELLLRGPQTTGELKGRISRMGVELDIPGVQMLLDELAGADPAIVTVVPRLPGQSSVRYGHTLADEREIAASAAPTSQPMPSNTTAERTPEVAMANREWQDRMEALESAMDDLRSELARLSSKIDALTG